MANSSTTCIEATIVEKVMAAINDAKSVGWYGIANILFAILLDLTIRRRLGVKYILETNGEWYFDLLVIATDNERVCIPRPLLARWLNRHIESLEIVDRLEHRRQLTDDTALIDLANRIRLEINLPTESKMIQLVDLYLPSLSGEVNEDLAALGGRKYISSSKLTEDWKAEDVALKAAWSATRAAEQASWEAEIRFQAALAHLEEAESAADEAVANAWETEKAFREAEPLVWDTPCLENDMAEDEYYLSLSLAYEAREAEFKAREARDWAEQAKSWAIKSQAQAAESQAQVTESQAQVTESQAQVTESNRAIQKANARARISRLKEQAALVQTESQ